MTIVRWQSWNGDREINYYQNNLSELHFLFKICWLVLWICWGVKSASEGKLIWLIFWPQMTQYNLYWWKPIWNWSRFKPVILKVVIFNIRTSRNELNKGRKICSWTWKSSNKTRNLMNELNFNEIDDVNENK